MNGCHEMVEKIINAKDEEDLIRVITNSMAHLRQAKNSFNESGFVMNMIVALRAMDPTELTEEGRVNIKPALAIFRKLQKENPEHRV